MNIIELAKECGLIYEKKGLLEAEKLTVENFEAFANAIIENYKAGLVPVAYMNPNGKDVVEVFWVKNAFYSEPLYALPLGETK